MYYEAAINAELAASFVPYPSSQGRPQKPSPHEEQDQRAKTSARNAPAYRYEAPSASGIAQHHVARPSPPLGVVAAPTRAVAMAA